MSTRVGPPRVIVIGGGLPGLAAACRLASRGVHVLLLERQKLLGGKSLRKHWENWSWQLGPTPPDHPFALREFWTRLGRDFDAEIPQVPLAPRRCFWEDGHECLVDAEFWRQPPIAGVLRQAESLAERQRERPLPAADPSRLSSSLGPSLGSLLDRLDNPRHAQLLRHLACPPGSHPWKVPGSLLYRLTLQALPGGRAILGGSSRLVAELEGIARQSGVEIRSRCEVLKFRRTRSGYRILVRDHHSETSQRLDCEGLICSSDTTRARHELRHSRHFRPRPTTRADWSLSGFVSCLALSSQPTLLGPRNLFLTPPEAERQQFDRWFQGRQLPPAPTLELTVENRLDPAAAPAGGDSWLIRTHAPLLGPQIAWESRARSYADQLQHRLQAAYGLEISAVRYREILSPRDFAQHFDAPGGSLNGLAMHGRRALHRLPNRILGWRHFAFAGASVLPGPGLSAGILSGNLAAEALLRDFKLPL